MSIKMNLNFFIFATAGCMLLVSVTSSTTHVVGDNFGWNIPTEPAFYDNWAKKRTFVVGDALLFQYHAGLNTVVQVDKDDYDNCTTRRTIRTYFRGTSTVNLEKPGDYFFFSSVGKHCESGQKLHVTVSQGSSKSSR